MTATSLLTPAVNLHVSVFLFISLRVCEQQPCITVLQFH